MHEYVDKKAAATRERRIVSVFLRILCITNFVYTSSEIAKRTFSSSSSSSLLLLDVVFFLLFYFAFPKRIVFYTNCVYLIYISHQLKLQSVNLLCHPIHIFIHTNNSFAHNLSFHWHCESISLFKFSRKQFAFSLSVSLSVARTHCFHEWMFAVTFRSVSIRCDISKFCFTVLEPSQILYFVIVQWAMIKTKQILIYVLHIRRWWYRIESNRARKCYTLLYVLILYAQNINETSSSSNSSRKRNKKNQFSYCWTWEWEMLLIAQCGVCVLLMILCSRAD